jgi:hypothetical protein
MEIRIPNWPGHQINDINEFRHACFQKCHDRNPTDSGWYEKEDACGKECSQLLRQFQIDSGKNPCAQRLQAPVFWFSGHKDDVIRENYRAPELQATTQSSQRSTLDILYVVFLSVFLLLLLATILRFFMKQKKK